ncbi:hypothetical protein SEPCBS119000_002583 [Sporothrix epigloea]|uniref:Uncharacterized protein n=1 Tax=Sporothrix epigloea TaxID=1892477 RepID=A0ABP0DK76_9PEZI
MHTEIYAPISVSPQRKSLQIVTTTELFPSLTANPEPTVPFIMSYTGADDAAISIELPQFVLQDYDYTVPAAPPPSPVSFPH